MAENQNTPSTQGNISADAPLNTDLPHNRNRADVLQSLQEKGNIIIYTITVGGKKGQDLLDEMNHVRFGLFGGSASDLLTTEPTPTREYNSFEGSRLQQSTTLTLATVSPEALGFDHNATWKEISMRALDMGLALCPPEVGPELTMKYYRENVMPGRVVVGMLPIHSDIGASYIFQVDKGSSTNAYLDGISTDVKTTYRPKDKFVFCLPQA